MQKLDQIPDGADKEKALNLSGIIKSNTSSRTDKMDALTDLDAIFVKHGVGSFFNRNGHRVGGRRTRHTLRKKRTLRKARKTRRHTRRA